MSLITSNNHCVLWSEIIEAFICSSFMGLPQQQVAAIVDATTHLVIGRTNRRQSHRTRTALPSAKTTPQRKRRNGLGTASRLSLNANMRVAEHSSGTGGRSRWIDGSRQPCTTIKSIRPGLPRQLPCRRGGVVRSVAGYLLKRKVRWVELGATPFSLTTEIGDNGFAAL